MQRLEAENYKKKPEDRGKYAMSVWIMGESAKLWFNANGECVDEDAAFA